MVLVTACPFFRARLHLRTARDKQLFSYQQRFYSVSSSPDLFPGEVHLTVAVVQYVKRGKQLTHSNAFLGTVHDKGAVVVFSIARVMGQLAQQKRRGTELSGLSGCDLCFCYQTILFKTFFFTFKQNFTKLYRKF